MLATLVIGLREGLEAALIVGIIAAFLRRTGKSLRPMWIGVGIAVALSIAVGVILQVISADLPQAQQEAMESIIGFAAVAVVTGMIGWMNTHARTMKKELEAHAEHALRDGTVWALVGMAFLAVLKEGFETSVFLLAAFQSSTSSLAAGAGAVIGIAIAVGIGIGIFRGGVKINLGKFFRVTGLFLVFVAAGLVLASLRTAHEAGWITIGQQATITLNWLAPTGSIQAALLTGVLGIPADPRLIEVLGWFAYLVPVLAYLLWPAAKRPTTAQKPKVQLGIAAGLAVAAVALAALVTLPGSYTPAPAKLIATNSGAPGEAVLTRSGNSYNFATAYRGSHDVQTFTTADTKSAEQDGVAARAWTSTVKQSVASLPTSITLDELVTLNGGRLPIGVSASSNPGPFTATWRSSSTTTVWVYASTLLDATRTSSTIVTLSGGGLLAARTVSPPAGAVATSSVAWATTANYTNAVITRIADVRASASELLLWKLWIPLVFALAALVLAGYGWRSLRRHSRESLLAEREPTEPLVRPRETASARA